MRRHSFRRSRGFSLVEVLVGVGIGLIGILVMFRMVALYDTYTRTTTSGSDAQSAGTLAMFSLERDIRQAGLGFATGTPQYMGCTVTATDTGGIPRPPFTFTLLPINIVPGAAGAPDTVTTLYGDSSFYVEQQTFTLSTATTKRLGRRGGFRRGDLAVVAENAGALPATANCALIEVTDDTLPDNATITHASGGYNNFYATVNPTPSRYNPAGGTGGVFTAGVVYNLGPNPQLNVWTVGAGDVLTRTELIRNTLPFDAGDRVVNLKAEYGVDVDGDLRIDNWTTVAPANWTTVLAVRAGILVRGKQFEKIIDPVTNLPVAVTPTLQNPRWAGGPFVMRSVDGSADTFTDLQDDPNNWRFYRYRVYERVIPMRNLIWGTAP